MRGDYDTDDDNNDIMKPCFKMFQTENMQWY